MEKPTRALEGAVGVASQPSLRSGASTAHVLGTTIGISFQSVFFSSFHCLVTDVKNYVIAGSRSRTGNETNLTPFSLS